MPKQNDAQVVHVIRDLALQQLITTRLTIVRKVLRVQMMRDETNGLLDEMKKTCQQMDQIWFFLLHRLPAKLDDRPETQGLMILFPTMSN